MQENSPAADRPDDLLYTYRPDVDAPSIGDAAAALHDRRSPRGAPRHAGRGNLANSGRVYVDMERAMGSIEADAGPVAADTWLDFESYVRASERRHKRLAYLLAGDLHAAEDLLQAAYAKVYPKWGTVRTYESPDAYLRKVMVSLRTSWWRRHRNREWSTHEIPDTGSGADPGRAVAESQALLAALRRLPARQRAAVVLRHWCDLSEAETAQIMSCSRGTVKSNTSKGLAHLRAALGQAEGSPS